MKHLDQMPGVNGSFGLPKLPKTVPSRPRVLKRFEESFASGPLIMVCSAPGSGKTTAAADWAAGTGRCVAWISLNDEDQESSAALWNKVLRSWRQLANPGTDAFAIMDRAVNAMDAGEPLPELALRAVAALGDVTLVLDGIKSNKDPTFLKGLVKMLSVLPNFHAMLICNTNPLPGQGNLLRPVDVSFIREEDLFLTPAEVAAQVAAADSDLDPALVHLHTHGYAVLVRSLLTKHQSNPLSGTSKDMEVLVGTWIRSGLLALFSESAGYGDFMVRTSAAETLTVSLSEELSGRNDSAAILASLATAGMIMREGAGTYRYRTTIRTALRAELHSSHPHWAQLTRGVMIEHYLSRGMVPRALGIAVGDRDFIAAERIASRHHTELIYRHADETTVLLDEVPDAVMLKHPVLAMTAGLLMTRKSVSRDRGVRLLETSLAGVETVRSKGTGGVRLCYPLAEMVALRATGQFNEAVRKVPQVTEAMESPLPGSQSEVAGTLLSAYIQAGLTLLLGGWTTESRVMLRRAASAPSSLRNSAGQIMSLGLLGLSFALEGRITDAEKAVRPAAKLYEKARMDSWLHAPYLLTKALCEMERDNADAALKTLTDDDFSPYASELWPLVLSTRSMAAMLVDPSSADHSEIERVASGAEIRRSAPFVMKNLKIAASAIHLTSGSSHKAWAALEGLDYDPQVQLAKARIALAEGDFVKAEKLLPPDTVDNRPNVARVDAQRLLMKSSIAGWSGRWKEAEALQEQALKLSRMSGLGTHLLVLPVPGMEYLPGARPAPRAFIIPAVAATAKLTARERIVLTTLAGADSGAAAAKELGVSLNTVKSQSRSIYRKLKVSTLRDALTEARRLRLI